MKLSLIAFAVIFITSCSISPVQDVMNSPELGSVHLQGAVEAKMENFFEHRIYSQFARDSIFGEARDAFKNRIDDTFKAPAGYWQGEFWGKLMIGTSRVAQYKNSPELLDFVKAEAHRILEFQEADGYLGTYSNKAFVMSPDPNEAMAALGWNCDYNWNLWCRKYTMWGLLACYEATGDKVLLDAVVRSMDQEISMLDSLNVDVWATGTAKFLGFPSCSVLKPLMTLYKHTGYKRYLTFAEKIVSNWDCEDRQAPALITNAFTDVPVYDWYDDSATWAKAYEMMSCLDGLLEYYRITGEQRILDAVIRIQKNLWNTERNQMWSVGFNDKFSGGSLYPNGISEPCDVIHWIRLNHDLFLITGDPSYVDVMELSFFNAFLAGVFKEGDWGARGVRTEGYHTFALGQSGMKYNHCCVDNMPRCFMDVAQTLVTTDRRGDVYVNWYSDFEASIDGVQIKVGGNYPMDSKVSVKVSCEGKRNVSLRVPSWCEKMTVDGVEATGRWFCCAINSNHTFEIEFLMNFEVVRPNRQTIENYGNPDFRKDRWICGDKDLLPYLRKSPCYQIVRGPVIFAKSIYVGDTSEQIFHTTPLDKDIKVVEMNRIDVPEVWGAWAVTLSDGTMVNVCDYGSACDTRHKERGYQFSVYF